MSSLLLGLLGLGLGLASGVATLMVHQTWWLALAAAVVVLTLLWLPAGVARLGFAAGLGLSVLRGAIPRGEGDYLIPANGPGWAVLVGAFVVLLVAIATVARRGHADGDREDPPAPT